MAHSVSAVSRNVPYSTWSGGGASPDDVGLLTNYLESVLPMRSMIRPDVDTSAYALHRNAYPGIEYNRPLPIRNGSFPFHSVRVITGPAGFTINTNCVVEANGSITLDPNYMRMIWPNPTTGSHPISIGISDQNLSRGTQSSTELVVSFTLEVGTANWIELDVNGAITSLSSIYTTDRTDTTYQDKLVLVRAGTYNMDVFDTTVPQEVTDQLCQWNTNKPLQFLAYPGESVSFDFSNAVLTVDDASADDMAFSGINFINSSSQTRDNKHNILVRANIDRFMIDNMTTSSNGSNPTSNENPAVITATDDGATTPRNDWSFTRCTHDATNDSPLFVLYNTTFCTDEITFADGSDGNQGAFYAKAGNPDSCMTRMTYVGSPYTSSGDWFTSLGGQASGSGSVDTDNIEVRYSVFRFGDSELSSFAFRMVNSAGANGNYFMRRCTVAGRIFIPNWSTYTSTVEDCVLLAASGQHIDAPAGTNTFNDTNNVKITTADARLNADGTLVDSDAALGVQGFELALQV